MRDASDWKRWNDLSLMLDNSLLDFSRAFASNVASAIRGMERDFKAAEGRWAEQKTEQKTDAGLVKIPRALAAASGFSLGIDIPSLVRIAPERILSMNSKISFIERDASPTRALSLVLETGSGRRGGAADEGAEGDTERAGEQLGFSQALWLKASQADFPQLLAIRGEFCIHFPATIGVRAANDWRFVPCLMFAGDALNIYWHRVGDRDRVTYIARGR